MGLLDDDTYESVLVVIRECMVYRIPPRSNARGYRAADWDITQHMWTGRLRVIARGDDAFINLEDGTTGEIFAQCPYNPDGSSVESVTDSSRYFVLRIVDKASGKHAFIGMGFTERSSAFDFNVALQDHTRRVKQAKEAHSAKPASAAPKMDYSWKEGQTITINIGSLKSSKPAGASSENLSGASGGFTMLPPPPSRSLASGSSFGSTGFLPPPPSKQQQQQPDPFAASSSASADPSSGWADFGDFVGSNPTSTSKESTAPSGWETF
ncbi:adaptin ear-binding coat-associated protein 2 [Polychytrium aggregatum]|uniref:adaptin ear-binding coat-associated protein 2 n=1 Tax=Polychytrium aggregatum TaxID=110093 RepID=UPI0022FE2558|nr:adaptin ear-binding coat-associated protein 2 [Polychytrium aggregatum]KAI9204388.1 adaptin ear-binding coat-associated protein 2 [Polychytrium aggregatum]